MEINEKFCPVCKNKNVRKANVCIHCGALLIDLHSDSLMTISDAKALESISARITDSPIEDSLIPDDGIAIYAAGTMQPVYLCFDKELILGRRVDGSSEDNVFDLSEIGGYQAGISRRHAMIRRGNDGYEIIDLSSTNGSWLNNERLVPNKSVPLASRSQLRFGQMRLLIVHHSVSKKIRTAWRIETENPSP